MTTATASLNTEVSNPSTKRDWHKKPSFQLFIKSLAAGEVTNEVGEPMILQANLSELMMAHIDSKQKFMAMVEEHANNDNFVCINEHYTIPSVDLFTQNNDLILSFNGAARINTNKDMCWHLFSGIRQFNFHEDDYQNLAGAILHGAVLNNKGDDKKNTSGDSLYDVWYMLCNRMNNSVLERLLTAYGIYVGIIDVVPVKQVVYNSITVTEHTYDSSRLDFVSEKMSDSDELLDTDIKVGDTVLLTINGSDIDAFTAELHELTAKYHIANNRK